VGLHDHHGAALRARFRDSGLQLALGDELQVRVDGQLERGSRWGLLVARVGGSERVALEQDLARAARDEAVLRGLDAASPALSSPTKPSRCAARSRFG